MKEYIIFGDEKCILIEECKKMIGEDAYCNDVLVQLSAIENSVKSLFKRFNKG